jgi:hypothetical protein
MYILISWIVLAWWRNLVWISVSSTFYDKRDDFTFPLFNFPFTSSNIPALPAYGVYISQLLHYSRAGVQYSDFLDRTQTLTQKLFKQGYVAPRLKLPLQ